MDITVSSRQVEVSPGLRAATVEKIGRLDRYVDGIDRAEVHFLEEKNPRLADRKEVCEVTLHGNGRVVRAKVAAPDQFAAGDLAVDKRETQLHKLKTRLVARHNGKGHATAGKSAVAVAEEADEAAPSLVKTKRFRMTPMDTDEAILQMELLGHTFFLFQHVETGEAAVVYRRADGDVGLIQAVR